jgi:hypothetical protein
LATGQLQIDDLITHRFALADVNSALELMETRSERTWLISVQVAADEPARSKAAGSDERSSVLADPVVMDANNVDAE